MQWESFDLLESYVYQCCCSFDVLVLVGGVDSDNTEKKIPECRVLRDGKLEPNQACDIYDVQGQELQDFLKAKEIMVKRFDKSKTKVIN